MSEAVPEAAPPAGPDALTHRLHPLSPLLRGGIVVVAITIAAGRQLLEGGAVEWPLPVALVVVAAFLAVVGWAALSWWTTRYQIGAGALRIETGILVRRSRRIRLDRVQAVEVQQPLLARLFGMAELQIETAGGDTEAALAYLTLGHAQRLRVELLAHATPSIAGSDAMQSAEMREGPTEVLHPVPAGLLLASQLVRTGPLLAILAALIGFTLSIALGEPFGFALILPAGLALVAAVGRGFVSHYGFTLTRSSRGLAVRAGLFDVRSQSIPVDRVQGVAVLEPLVWRRLGWCEVLVTVAGVQSRGDDGARLSTTLVPVVAHDQGARIAIDALAGRDVAGIPLSPVPERARLLDPVARHVLALGASPVLVVTRRGWLTRRTDIVPRHKVQSCSVRQGPVQRQLRLATVHVDLPPGPVDAQGRHREQADAWDTALTLATPSAATANV